jgi:alkylation response protein AidB-like acyl-CoA dehydrogenase
MPGNLPDLMEELGPDFAARGARHDVEERFVAENYATLKQHGVLRAAVPAEATTAGKVKRASTRILKFVFAMAWRC